MSKYETLKNRIIKATIYLKNDPLGFIEKYEVTLIKHGILNCQFLRNPPFITFVYRYEDDRKCKIIQSRKPYLLILKGWDHPAIPKHTYACRFDQRTNKKIAKGLVSVIADYRLQKGDKHD